jgi:hypothetical protein
MKTKENQLNITEEQIKKLPPNKKRTVEALLKGQTPEVVAKRIAEKRNSSLIIARAYVKMIVESFQEKEREIKTETGFVLTPLNLLIVEALRKGETPDELIGRLSIEMDIEKNNLRNVVNKAQIYLERKHETNLKN